MRDPEPSCVRLRLTRACPSRLTSMEELLNKNILDDLVKYSYSNIPVGVIRETVKLFSELVNSPLQARFLTQGNVHGPLNRLLRSLDWDRLHAYEEEIMEFLYGICEKIHEYPELLYIFFEPDRAANRVEDDQTGDGKAATEVMVAFPLLALLLRHVQAPTRLGDISRTALGKLLELSQPGSDLENFAVTKAELPQLFVASLGASWAYSFSGAASGRSDNNESRVSTPSLQALDKVAPARRSADLIMRPSLSKFSSASDLRGASEDEDPLGHFTNLLQFVQSIITKSPTSTLAKAIASEFDSHFLSAILHESVVALQGDLESPTPILRLLSALSKIIGTIEEASSGSNSVGGRRRLFPEDGVSLMDPIVRFLLAPEEHSDKEKPSVRSVLLSFMRDERDEVAIPAVRLVDHLCGSSRGYFAVGTLIQSLPPWAGQGIAKTAPENRSLLFRMRMDAVPEVARWLALMPEDAGEHSIPSSPSRRRRRSLSPTPQAPSSLAFVDPTQMVPYPVAEDDLAGDEEAKSKAQEDPDRALSTYIQDAQQKMAWISRPGSPGADAGPEDAVPSGVAPGREHIDEAALTTAIQTAVSLQNDEVISLLLSLLSAFYRRSFDLNLAVTGLIHRLAMSPYPLLYAFFVAGDHLALEGEGLAQHTVGSSPFLYPILSDLVNLAEERKMDVISSRELLAEARHQIAFPPVGVPNPALMKKLGYEENERKKAQWKNIVVLEEVVKEWIALVEVGATTW